MLEYFSKIDRHLDFHGSFLFDAVDQKSSLNSPGIILLLYMMVTSGMVKANFTRSTNDLTANKYYCK